MEKECEDSEDPSDCGAHMTNSRNPKSLPLSDALELKGRYGYYDMRFMIFMKFAYCILCILHKSCGGCWSVLKCIDVV